MPSKADAPDRPHLEYRELGYDPIPICPPGAPLAPGSKIDPTQAGKIPARRGSNGYWAGFDWWRHEASNAELERWAESGAGVGLRTGLPGSVVGLDIDCLDAGLAEWVEGQARQCLGNAPLRIGQAPKRMLVYAIEDSPLSEPIGNLQLRLVAESSEGDGELVESSEGDGELVETRGRGQQIVVDGVHPATGQPYEWPDGPLPAWDELPVVDADDMAALFQRLADRASEAGYQAARLSVSGAGTDRDRIDQDALKGRDLDHLAEAVAAIRNTSEQFPGRADYVRVANAIKAAFADDEERGLSVWLDWCSRWEDGDNDPDVARDDWRRCKPPFELGAPWLYELARADGFNDAPRLFEVHDDPEPGEADTTETGPGGSTGVEYWDRYIWVESLERFVDLRNHTLLSASQFAARYPSVGKGIRSQENAAMLWLANEAKRRTVWTTTYRPLADDMLTENGLSAVNLWTPGPIHGGAVVRGEPGDWDPGDPVADSDIEPWLALVRHLFPDELSPAARAAGMREPREILLDWLAHQIQSPGVKCGWHPVIGGAQGVGKDTLLIPVIEAVGQHNTQTISTAELQSQWTDWAQGVSLVVCQELNSWHRRELTDKLKPFLAAPPDVLRINIKGLPQFTQPNVLNMVMLTNHEDAITVENGDRRLFVAWSEAAPWSGSAYRALYRWLYDEGGIPAVARWLAQRDLGEFRPTDRAPDTAAKRAMQRAAAGSLDGELLDMVEAKEGPFVRDTVTVSEVVSHLQWQHGGAAEQALGVPITSRRIGMALNRLGFAYLGRVRVEAGGKAERVYTNAEKAERLRIVRSDPSEAARFYREAVRRGAHQAFPNRDEDGGDDLL